MGCDIHTFVEVRQGDTWHYFAEHIFTDLDGPTAEPFAWRSYGTFGFLADVRNYSHVPVIAPPRGFPDDVTAEVVLVWRELWDQDGHSASWLTVAELTAFDYDQVFWDRRVTKNGNGAALADEGEGEHLTVREFLGTGFFHDLDQLATLGAPEDVRVVFWFDN